MRVNILPVLTNQCSLFRWAPHQNVFMIPGKPAEKFRPYDFCLQKTGLTHEEFYRQHGSSETTNYTITRYLEDNKLMDECIEWLKRYYPTACNASGGQGKTFIQYLGKVSPQKQRLLRFGLEFRQF